MVLQNSSNQSFSNNADGYSLGGGVTRRTLTLSGADLSILLNSVALNDILQFNGTNWVNVPATTFGTGSVTNIATGTGLTGGPITNTGTISVAANGISNALFRQSGANTIVGNPTGATADVQDISLGTGLTFSGTNLQLDVSGVTAGTYGNGSNYTTFTVDAFGRITNVGTVALGGMAFQNPNSVNITGGTITGMSNPVNPTDVANKAYVDGISAGLDAKQAVRAATTADLNATYSGTPNFTLTANTNGSIVVDGITLGTGDRVLAKNQATETENGIYSVTQTGDGTSPFILTRTVDMNVTSEVPAAFTFVVEGSQGGNGYVVTGFTESDVLDTNNIVWTQFSQAGAYSTASNGGLSIDTSNVPALFKINFTNMVSAGALGSSDFVAVSQDGTTVVKTTIGDLAAEIAGMGVSGTGAIHATSGTISLVTDGEFSQSGGTLSLGDITPTSVTSTGTISGLNLSGTNTGDQTITLTGDVTGSGTGSFATTLATVNSNVGTFTAVTVNGKGLVTAATNLAATGDATGVASGTSINLTLANSGVTANTYGDNTHPAIVTVDAKGRVTSASTGSIALGTGSVTNIITGTGLIGGPITNSGTISMATSGVTAGTYAMATIVVDALGRVTSATATLVSSNLTFISNTLDLSDTGVTPGTYSSVVVDAKGRITAGTGTALSWVDVTGTTQTMSANIGYMADNAALVTLTLPLSANFGDIIPIIGFGSGGWEIAQNPGQIIHFGNQNTTSGTMGSLASNNQYDSLELFCAVANTDFIVRNAVGNISVN